MFRPRTLAQPRHGVILLLVLALLTLFAVAGLAFLLYADSQAMAARFFRESETSAGADADPERLLALFLGQLLYDAPDDAGGVYSGLRGHSLARSMYGYDDADSNDVPFNGSGRLHGPSPFAALPVPGTPSEARDDYYLINYTYFRDDPQLQPAQRFLRDPERHGSRPRLDRPRGPFAGGFNAPYTYPDLNNLFLAAVKADGTVLLPSFHRPWLFGPNDRRNPNWTNVAGKYLLVRPRPIDMGPGFPYPEDEGGDVKNLIGAPGGNDSYWIDLDASVLTAPDGTQYKPLFAPLIVDLDNRVNLNVHGNARGRDLGHVSNHGFGPWEVNPRRLVGDNEPRELEGEWANLLGGRAAPPLPGRYGFGGPGRPPANVAPPRPAPPFYARFDFDGCNNGPGGGATGPVELPGFGASPTSCFPRFPAGYGSGSLWERTDHPSVYNPLQPTEDDRAFAVSNLEALLRHGDTGSPALTSELLRLCPHIFGADPSTDPLASARRRRLVTTHSFDVDKPGVSPWIADPRAQPYILRGGSPYPRGGPVAIPTQPRREPSAALGRVDLNRPLPAYPAPDPNTRRITDRKTFGRAQAARVQLARDLFDRLRAVTGAAEPARATPVEFDALRWLAQLAVNMVDYVDADDYLTPFDWHTDDRGSKHWAFGTELPRLVLNDVYVEIGNTPGDRGLPRRAEQPLRVNFWVELLNPLAADPSLSNGGAARLRMPEAGTQSACAVHRLVIARSPNPGLRQPDRILGDPDPGNTLLVVSDFAPDPVQPPPAGVDLDLIQPVNDRFAGTPGGNDGFYLLGPQADFPGSDSARPPATLRVRDQMIDGARSALTYELNGLPPGTLPKHTLLLQRLACPGLPPNPARIGGPVDPHLPYNPYVTVDYLEDVPANDALLADADGPRQPTPVAARRSVGRNQPYAAHRTAQKEQRPDPPLSDQPQHTFFRHNAASALPPPRPGFGQTLKVPFDWLVHLDRPLISPLEMMHVSAFKPHELTQQFVTLEGPFRHTAPWLDPESRLYRVLEFLTTGPGGRTPGKINLNTLWDPEPLLALCDPQPGNSFTLADVYRPLGSGPGADSPGDPQSIYWRMMLTRTPGQLTGGGPGPDDRPFAGLAASFVPVGDPQHPLGGGLEDTLLRSFEGTGTRRLFQPPLRPAGSPDRHPWLAYQLLTKIANQVTTRSNVFAVWLTVGFFEVTDAEARPVKLGAERGRAEGRHVRHRMFAVVDRSVLPRNPGPQPAYDPRRDPFGAVPYFSVID
jgi:hypothetical protein